MSRAVLVVGGAGYIGSHTAKLLFQRGYDVVVLDDLSTGHREAARRATKDGKFYQGSYGDLELVRKILRDHRIHTVMHFGAKSLVEESTQNPLLYYQANVGDTTTLLQAMIAEKTATIIFSSTCATFGPCDTPINERTPQRPINPYGSSKLMVEQILRDCESVYGVCAGILRYFNAAGADPSGEIGEDHHPETHLIPNILKSALGSGSQLLTVYGTDYPTHDGSCVRDYVHVNDLADAHIKLMEQIAQSRKGDDINLGSGKGYSVFEVLAAVKAVTGLEVPHRVGPRRPGDSPLLVADNTKAREVLKWKIEHDIESIVRSALAFVRSHPQGF